MATAMRGEFDVGIGFQYSAMDGRCQVLGFASGAQKDLEGRRQVLVGEVEALTQRKEHLEAELRAVIGRVGV